MAVPGIGSVVIFYWNFSGENILPIPAFVLATHDSWQPAFADQYGMGQPAEDQVLLQGFGPYGGQVNATEGTGAGQFSRISLSLDLGTIDLGSVDLSTQVATNVSVPDA
jgi:hypothetical protein